MTRASVSIQFRSLTDLWGFRLAVGVNVFDLNMSKLTITCERSKDDIDLAIQKYKGRLMEKKTEKDSLQDAGGL